MCYGTFPAKRHIMTAGPAGGLPVPLKEGNEDEILHDQAAEIFRRRDSGDSEFLQQKLTAAVDEKSHEKSTCPQGAFGFLRSRARFQTRLTNPDFSALALTQTRFGLPSTRIRTFCTLTPHLRFVRLLAWETLWPVPGFLPVIKHLRDIRRHLLTLP